MTGKLKRLFESSENIGHVEITIFGPYTDTYGNYGWKPTLSFEMDREKKAREEVVEINDGINEGNKILRDIFDKLGKLSAYKQKSPSQGRGYEGSTVTALLKHGQLDKVHRSHMGYEY